MADSSRNRLEGEQPAGTAARATVGSRRAEMAHHSNTFPPGPGDRDGWERWRREGGPQPSVCRGSDGTQDRVERLRLLGNGVVPQQAALAFLCLWGRLK